MTYKEYLDEGYYNLQKALNLIECKATNCIDCINELSRILSDLSFLNLYGG